MKNKLTNEAQLLALFYDIDYYREQIRTPFLSDGYVCATETHRLIMINPEICTGEYKQNGLHVLETIGKDKIDLTITLSEIKSALERIATEKEMKVIRPEVKCEDCDGGGEVEWTYEDKDGYTHTEYFRCPVCDGSGVSVPAKEVPTGRLVPPDEACIGIDKRRFIASHIQALCDAMELLNLDKVRYVVSGQRGDMFVLTDDIKVILCPVATNRVCPWIRPKRRKMTPEQIAPSLSLTPKKNNDRRPIHQIRLSAQ